MFTDKSAARVRKFPSVHCRESLSPARPPTQHNPAPSWIKILIVDHQSRMPRSVWISVTFSHLAKTLIYNQLMDHFLPTDTFENAKAGLLTPHLLFKLAFCLLTPHLSFVKATVDQVHWTWLYWEGKMFRGRHIWNWLGWGGEKINSWFNSDCSSADNLKTMLSVKI